MSILLLKTVVNTTACLLVVSSINAHNLFFLPIAAVFLTVASELD